MDSFKDAYAAEVGSIQRVCVVDHAAKHSKLVAHNDHYTQVCYFEIHRRSVLLHSRLDVCAFLCLGSLVLQLPA